MGWYCDSSLCHTKPQTNLLCQNFYCVLLSSRQYTKHKGNIKTKINLHMPLQPIAVKSKSTIELKGLSATMHLTLFLVLLWTGGGFSQCYTRRTCTGSTVQASSKRACCIGTDNGLAFRSGGVCSTCIGELCFTIQCVSLLQLLPTTVHGFTKPSYNVQEYAR